MSEAGGVFFLHALGRGLFMPIQSNKTNRADEILVDDAVSSSYDKTSRTKGSLLIVQIQIQSKLHAACKIKPPSI